jgi:hypothetical protein
VLHGRTDYLLDSLLVGIFLKIEAIIDRIDASFVFFFDLEPVAI